MKPELAVVFNKAKPPPSGLNSGTLGLEPWLEFGTRLRPVMKIEPPEPGLMIAAREGWRDIGVIEGKKPELAVFERSRLVSEASDGLLTAAAVIALVRLESEAKGADAGLKM
jgi:hypothetical protein